MRAYYHLSKALAALLCTVIVGGCPNPSQTRTDTTISSEEQSLYVRLGGIETLRPLVDEWMLEVTSDPAIRDFFMDADISQLKERLLERLCVLSDGPCLYKGRSVFQVHASMELEDGHLRRFLVGLDAAMKRLEIAPEPASELQERMRGMAAEIAAAAGR